MLALHLAASMARGLLSPGFVGPSQTLCSILMAADLLSVR